MRATAAVALVLAALSLGAAAADLGPARTAVEQRDYATALPMFDRLLDAEPNNVDLLIEAARVYGFADRNRDAARLYRRALVQAPERRADILPSLAWQTLWSGDFERAAEWFAELADRRPAAEQADALDGLAQARQNLGDAAGALKAWQAAVALQPTDVPFVLRIARTLLWSDRPQEAVKMLEPLQRLHPHDREIAWTLANARNFAGQHRAALAGFNEQDAPTRDGERLDLARALRWAGYEDRALPLLEGQTDPDVVWLRQYRVERETKPFAAAGFDYASDRDDLTSRALTLSGGWHPTPGAVAEISLRQLSLSDPHGSPSGPQLQGLWRGRFGEPTDPNGTFWPTAVLRVANYSGWNAVTGAARLAWVPRDDWRIDGELGREAIETPEAIGNRVTVDTLSAGVTYRPAPRLSVAGAIAALNFDDGNLRWRGSGRVEGLLTPNPRWSVGVEGQTFTSSDPTRATNPGRGYWNPRHYTEARVFTALSYERRPWDVQGRLGAGYARETDGDGHVSSGNPNLWELTVGYDLNPGLRFGLGVGGTGSGFGMTGGSGTGYWRRTFNVSVTGWF